MIDPFPNCFSICPTARSTAFARSRSSRSFLISGDMRISSRLALHVTRSADPKRSYSRDVPSESQAQISELNRPNTSESVTYTSTHFRLPAIRVAFMCAAAYATHRVLDWLAVDALPPYGIQAFWPFSDAWVISGWNLFRQTELRHFLSAATMWTNLQAMAQEMAILA